MTQGTRLTLGSRVRISNTRGEERDAVVDGYNTDLKNPVMYVTVEDESGRYDVGFDARGKSLAGFWTIKETL